MRKCLLVALGFHPAVQKRAHVTSPNPCKSAIPVTSQRLLRQFSNTQCRSDHRILSESTLRPLCSPTTERRRSRQHLGLCRAGVRLYFQCVGWSAFMLSVCGLECVYTFSVCRAGVRLYFQCVGWSAFILSVCAGLECVYTFSVWAGVRLYFQCVPGWSAFILSVCGLECVYTFSVCRAGVHLYFQCVGWSAFILSVCAGLECVYTFSVCRAGVRLYFQWSSGTPSLDYKLALSKYKLHLYSTFIQNTGQFMPPTHTLTLTHSHTHTLTNGNWLPCKVPTSSSGAIELGVRRLTQGHFV